MYPEAIQLLKEYEDNISALYDAYPYDGCTGTAPTGEPYITYSYSVIMITALDALEHYIKRVKESLPEPKPRLFIYWRTRPEILENEGQYRIWSRFLISDKAFFSPVIEER